MKRLFCAVAFTATAFSASAQDIKGTWLTEEGEARVNIEACGTQLCGKIVWLKQPTDAKGVALKDANNSDATLRSRPILGLTLLEMTGNGSDGWKGSLYDPNRGKTFSGTAKLKGGDKLVVEGCAVGGLICDDETWTRVK